MRYMITKTEQKAISTEEFLNNEAEAHQRLEQFLEILCVADKRHLEQLLNERNQKAQAIDSQIEESDKKIIQRKIGRSDKNYNLTQAAHLLKVDRQTIYYWMKKGWVKPKRDYRNYPVFTVLDIENIIKQRNSVKLAGF